MTENEAIKALEQGDKNSYEAEVSYEEYLEAIEMGKKALSEIQAYQAIGTVEECKNSKIIADERYDYLMDDIGLLKQYASIGTAEECRTAVERMKPKKVIHRKGSCYALAKDGTREYEIIQECPNCHSIALKYSYPCRCGQVLDWSE